MQTAFRWPNEASRRVNGERLMLLAWSRAILLQFAHPLIAAGVHGHSSFRSTHVAAARRLHGTVRAMLAITFGAESERAQTIERIRAIHRRVNGRLPMTVGAFPAGTPYSAEDPSLVLWVHATLIESVPLYYEMLVGPLSKLEHDAYCEQAAAVAVALGAVPADVPRSRAALRAYIETMYRSGHIAVGPQARELAAHVLAPFGRVAAPAASLNRLLTVATLPAALREQYGFEWKARDEKLLALAIPGLRLVRRMLPDVAAKWAPARRLRALEQRSPLH